MDASLFHTLQSTRIAAANNVANALAPKSTRQSTRINVASAGTIKPQSAATTNATASSTSSSTSTSDTGSSTITSSDFLTLLVSELKNQDPTQPTDPNEYISQLVGVNSLEQLIQINSGLSGIEPPAKSTSTSSSVLPAHVNGTNAA